MVSCPKGTAGKSPKFRFRGERVQPRRAAPANLLRICLEKDYEHHPFNCSDPIVNRRAANLAVQRRLGLLSDRRPRFAGADRFDSRFVQTHLVPEGGGGSLRFT
jgi:hypothetical protein